jgi:hypothetical protein
MADDDKTQPGDASTEATPATQAGATEAATQAAPPPTPPKPPKPPKQPGAGMTLPAPVVVIGAIVLVAALVFGFISFTGKGSAEDDKKKAEKENTALIKDNKAKDTEIEAANEEIAELEDTNESLSQQAGQSEEFAAALNEVLGTGSTAADALYQCATTAYDFILNFLNSGNADPGQAQAVDDRCLSAEDQYNVFIDALNQLEAA